MHKANWDDYRFILAIAERGTSMAAATRLGVNHTTVLRRISAFEAASGVKLFTRLPTGYVPTAAGEAVITVAREMSEKLSEVRRDVLGGAVRLEGTLSVTTTDTIMEAVLTPHLASFCARHPSIDLDMSVTGARLNLTRRDADIAVRPALHPPSGLIARRVSGLAFAIYGTSQVIDAMGERPHAEQTWVGLGEGLQGAPAAEWMRRTIPTERIAVRLDTFPGMRDCVAAGIGLAVLPCCLGDPCPALHRVGELMRDLDTSIWVLTHRDLDGTARVSAFIDHISAGLEGNAALLEGRT